MNSRNSSGGRPGVSHVGSGVCGRTEADQDHSPVKPGNSVEAVFVGENKQPLRHEDRDTEMVSTVWIYYGDMTFDQYAEVDGEFCLFSTGTYQLGDGADFIFEEDEEDCGSIEISSSMKYKPGEGLVPCDSFHTYQLNTLGFEQPYPGAQKKGPEVLAAFYGDDKQPFDDGEDGVIDTLWICFKDGTFCQHAEIGNETGDGGFTLFNTGTFDFADEESDFVYGEGENGHGYIIIHRSQKYQPEDGLSDYESTHTYELGTLGFAQLAVVTE